MKKIYQLTWDWRESVDIDKLKETLMHFGVYVQEVDTGADRYAIVLSDTPIGADEAREFHFSSED